MYGAFFDELEKIAVATAEKPNWKKRLAASAAGVAAATLGSAAFIAAKRHRKGALRSTHPSLSDIEKRISKAEKGVGEFKKLISNADKVVRKPKTKRHLGNVIDLAEARKARGLS